MTLVEMLRWKADEIERDRAISAGPSLAILLRDTAAELLAVGEQIVAMLPVIEQACDELEFESSPTASVLADAWIKLLKAYPQDNATQSSPQAPTE